MPHIKHVHVNEMDGNYPGFGPFDFASILDVLRQEKYQGYVSVEVFDYALGAEFIAREGLRHLKAALGER
jgi:sugar phosphate isomerase/epimerase